MKFPFLALGMGLLLLLLVLRGSQTGDDGTTVLPLLTLLIICEFAFIANAVATYFGVKEIRASGASVAAVIVTVLSAVVAIVFAVLGVRLWPL